MRRSWTGLGAVVLAVAVALAALARRPQRPARAAPLAPPPPLESATLVVREGALSPDRVDAVLGHRLAVTTVNRGASAVRLALSGYEHAFAPRTLAPGESRTDTLLLGLPGEDFAWMLDGRLAGRLRVAGSHLAEGHR